MEEIRNGLATSFQLVLELDPYLVEISLRSLRISLSATLIASLIAIPLAALLAIASFPGRRAAIVLLSALMGLPPVAVGLFLYVLLSPDGPLGVLELLFTPGAMIMAQVVIITPLIASTARVPLAALWQEYAGLLTALRLSPWQRLATVMRDCAPMLLTSALAGFGRAVGEVGAIMIVGGNIDGLTRVLTTAITLETGKGNIALALALGTVLVGLALLVSAVAHVLAGREAALATTEDG